MSLTVAIVTARKTEDTHYHLWRELGLKFLRRQYQHPLLSGEWSALLASLGCFSPVAHHVVHQLRALALQTRLPEEVIIVDRCFNISEADALADELTDLNLPFRVTWTQPCLSHREVSAHPVVSRPAAYLTSRQGKTEDLTETPERPRSASFINSDKNTALLLCRTPYLMMLDDCCLPGFACVETAFDACQRGEIAMFGHRKFYLPSELQKDLDHADANWHEATDRRVFGVWAMPIKYVLDVNGFNTALDVELHKASDLELLSRMDLYVSNRGLKYCYNDAMRVYEIEHEALWKEGGGTKETWTATSWRAPGPDLAQLREQLCLKDLDDNLDEEDEADAEGEE